MKILLDDSLVYGEVLFEPYGELRSLPAALINEEALAWADVLICRSKVRIDEALIGSRQLLFIGSATTGVDHVDQELLRSRNISFFSAAGCNAESVADYVIAAFSKWLLAEARTPQGLRAGVIGYGHIGRLVAQRLEALGLELRISDPPLTAHWNETATKPDVVRCFAPLNSVLDADVVSLHTSLVTSGTWPTHHLLHTGNFTQLPPKSLLLSCGRGAVVANDALIDWAVVPGHAAVVDVWEGEPELDEELLNAAWLLTPHIAGYSLDGRIQATLSVRDAMLCRLNMPQAPTNAGLLPEITTPQVIQIDIDSTQEALTLITEIYDPGRDQESFLYARKHTNHADAYTDTRKKYWPRRDFSNIRIQGAKGDAAHILGGAGFQLY